MHVEDDIQNLSPIIENRNSYPREDINSGDYHSMVLIYDGNLGDTVITLNTDTIRNNIPH